MEQIRAKFYCHSVKSDEYGEHVKLSAVYGTDDKDNEENNQFCEATPSGEFEMLVSNPSAKGFIKEGKEYYLDISEAK
jgi:hypothetical protein